MEPKRFMTRRLGVRLFSSVIDVAPSESMKRLLAFQYGVVEVRNHNGLPSYVPSVDSGIPTIGKHMSDEQLETFAPAEVHEVGQVIYEASFLGQGSTGSYRALPSSLSHLAFLVVQDAASATSELTSKSSDEPRQAL